MEDLADDERERLLSRYGRAFAAGDVIFREGDAGSEAFLLQAGRVALRKRVRTVDRNLMVLKSGDLFGESAFAPGSSRSSTAVALSDGVALALDHGTFGTLLATQPAIATRMVRQLVRRLRDAEEQIEIMMLRDAESRVIAALLKASAGRARTGGPFALGVLPIELATRAGVEVDVLRRVVQRFREAGYVRFSDEQLEVIDLDALRHLYALLGAKDELLGGQEREAPLDDDLAPRSTRA
jgi:CRP/FNR family cyclic AMP-dependent transcriptional regulator